MPRYALCSAKRSNSSCVSVRLSSISRWSSAALERSLDVVRRGGTVVVMGVYTSELVQAQVGVWWIRALQLRFAGTTPIHAWWERAMAEVVAGRLDPTPIVSHRLSLEEAPKGYELFDTKQATKVLLKP